MWSFQTRLNSNTINNKKYLQQFIKCPGNYPKCLQNIWQGQNMSHAAGLP